MGENDDKARKIVSIPFNMEEYNGYQSEAHANGKTLAAYLRERLRGPEKPMARGTVPSGEGTWAEQMARLVVEEHGDAAGEFATLLSQVVWMLTPEAVYTAPPGTAARALMRVLYRLDDEHTMKELLAVQLALPKPFAECLRFEVCVLQELAPKYRAMIQERAVGEHAFDYIARFWASPTLQPYFTRDTNEACGFATFVRPKD